MNHLYLFILFLIFYFTKTPFTYTYVGIDFAWHQAIDLAFNKKEIFGKEFIFNYGPLGFLNTYFLPKTVSVYVMVCFHLFLLANYFVALNILFKRFPSKINLIFCLFIISFLPNFSIGDASFNLMFILNFWLFQNKHNPKTWHWFFIIVASNLLVFIKLNLSIFGILFVLLYLFYQIINRQISLQKSICIVFILTILLFGLSYFLNVDLPSYLIATYQIINPYQDGISVDYLDYQEKLFLCFINAFIFFAVFYFAFKSKLNPFNFIFEVVVLGIFFIVLYKQTHTVLAVVNFQTLNKGMLSIFLLISIFILKNNFQKTFLKIVFTGYVLLSICNIYILNHKKSFSEYVNYELKKFTPHLYHNYVKSYNYENNFQKQLVDSVRIEDSILKIIGKNTIDILPTQIDHVFFNRLNYQHRPVIQSYQANSNWLQTQNGNFFANKNTRPTFVLANIQGFRDQNGIWMDKSSYQQILKNYSYINETVCKTKDTLLLFKKNSKILCIQEKVRNSQNGTFNEWISIPKDASLLYLKGDIKYNWLGKLKRFLIQPPFLFCEMKNKNGYTQVFRVPPPVLEGGILINYKVISTKELKFLAQNRMEKLVEIEAIRFIGSGFQNQFVYQISELKTI